MSQTGDAVVTLRKQARIAFITMNRPKALNALSSEVQRGIMDALTDVEQDDTIRAVILHGEGRAFSAGYDLGEDMGEHTPLHVRKQMRRIDNFAKAIWSFPKPLIAAVHGYCLGGACEVAMLCDLTIAEESASFGEPEIRFGAGSSLIMPWFVSMKAAKELLMSGNIVTARRAYDLGLVNQVVPDGSLLQAAEKKALLLAEIPPAALALTKHGINHSYELRGFLHALDYHSELVVQMLMAPNEEKEKFEEMCKEVGVKEATRWQKARFAALEQ